MSHPGHRQPQRHQQRRLDPLREDDAGRRGRRPGAEHLLRRHRPRHDRRRGRIALPRAVAAVEKSVSIPLAVKVGPFFSSMANMARRLVEAGADGLVLFNRFLQPDIDLETHETSTPHLVLSTSDELRLPLRWIAILRGRVDASLAATTGVHAAEGRRSRPCWPAPTWP